LMMSASDCSILKRFIFHLGGDYLSGCILTGNAINSSVFHPFRDARVTDSGDSNYWVSHMSILFF
ncbi:MAG: hypothetical protein KZQ89_21870, partial [Candidatus Thiodiazotropha sp. (ex Lucinoma kastoroae)]|nr:hypothetical protein [Candidatus Thiodiazotropha sp. (ex Lucinoma kastoroae)]